MCSTSTRLVAFLMLAGLGLGTGTATAGSLVRLDDPAPYDLQVAGFEISRHATVDLEAVGIWSRGDGSWVFSWLGVGDDQPQEPALGAGGEVSGERDASAGGRVLDRVVEQVGEGLLHERRVEW